MKITSEKDRELTDQIKKGLDLTFKKLLKSKHEAGGYLIFSKNGKIKKIKAADITEYIKL